MPNTLILVPVVDGPKQTLLVNDQIWSEHVPIWQLVKVKEGGTGFLRSWLDCSCRTLGQNDELGNFLSSEEEALLHGGLTRLGETKKRTRGELHMGCFSQAGRRKTREHAETRASFFA